MEPLPSVSARPRRPGPHPVIRADEVVVREDGVVAVRRAPHQLAVDVLTPPVAALVKGTQRVGEGD